MIDPEHDLPSSNKPWPWHQPQQRLLPAASYFSEDLWLMRRIDELHLKLSLRGQPHASRLAQATGLESDAVP